jgi:hypothetical protein
VRISPSVAVPVSEGAVVLFGAAALTVSVAALTAAAEPPALVAVTTTLMVLPMSSPTAV